MDPTRKVRADVLHTFREYDVAGADAKKFVAELVELIERHDKRPYQRLWIEAGLVSNYGDECWELTLMGDRLEDDAELGRRLEREGEYEKQRESYERLEFERLKKKFG